MGTEEGPWWSPAAVEKQATCANKDKEQSKKIFFNYCFVFFQSNWPFSSYIFLEVLTGDTQRFLLVSTLISGCRSFLGLLEANSNYWVLIAANIITTHTTVF